MASRIFNPGSEGSSLVRLLRSRAEQHASRRPFTWLSDGGGDDRVISFAELDLLARAIAVQLKSFKLKGARVALLYRPGLEFIAGLFGCFYSGLIAVPAYAPRSKRDFAQLQSILSDAQPGIVCTTASAMAAVESLIGSASHQIVSCIATDQIDQSLAQDWKEPVVRRDDLAYLQYTSGSTARPKGVMISHGNLLENVKYIDRGFAHTPESISLSWLPHFHDMGLVYGVLQPIYSNYHGLLVSPATFVQRPSGWLENISRYKVTHSGGPNFAYDLCVRRVKENEIEKLDLTSWRVAFNGAEPVRSETLARFSEKFAPCGFNSRAFYSAFGLAEATLKVTGGEPSSGFVTCTVDSVALSTNRIKLADPSPQGTSTQVGCGKASAPYRVAIVSPDSMNVCAEGEIGEIWVAGPSVAYGYWQQPEETERVFRAHIASTGEGPFLRTGDLGFLLDEELFVTGRFKDCIIIRGQNHYPQDIERSVEQCHPDLLQGSGAAFSVETGGQERLVVVTELQRRASRNYEEVHQAIRAAVAHDHELQVYAIVLVRLGGVPKTTSGKIQRQACRASFLHETLPSVARSILELDLVSTAGQVLTRADLLNAEPSDRQSLIESYLRSEVAEVLNLDKSEVDFNNPLAYLGLDSLMATELSYCLENNLSVVVPAAEILDRQSVRSLAALIAQSLEQPPEPALRAQLSRESQNGVFPLSYGQRALWFVEQLAEGGSALNISRSVRILSRLDLDALRCAFGQLLQRHPILRSRIFELDGTPVQQVNEDAGMSFSLIDASDWDGDSLNENLREETNKPFALDSPPLLRLCIYRRPAEEHILQFTIHHIVSDLWSIVILFNELVRLYEAELLGNEKLTQVSPIEYQDYVLWQQQTLGNARSDRLWDYWTKQFEGDLPPLKLPADHPRTKKPHRNGRFYTFKIDPETAQRIRHISSTQNSTVFAAMLGVFQVLLSRYTGEREFFIGCPVHNRERAELADAVGYFVNPLAIRVDLSGDPAFEDYHVELTRRVLEAFRHGSLPLALLTERFLKARDAGVLSFFDVMFVFQKAGVQDFDVWSPLAIGLPEARIEAGGLVMETLPLAPQMIQFELTLNVAESGGAPICCFEYDADLFDDSTIARMSNHLQQLMESIADEPRGRISELNLLSPAERRQIVVEWNDNAGEWRADACIQELVEEQALEAPDAVAVVWEGEQVSYGELNRRANRLAHRLIESGARAEERVGVCLERSPEMIVAMLGVLKSGAAYLPLDAQYPAERLGYMLADGEPLAVICSERTRSRFGAQDVECVVMDSGDERLDERHWGNPRVSTEPGNLAYLIYTSGSTGSPKGVSITHGSAGAMLAWAAREYQPAELRRVAAVTSICFDLSVFEIFVPLVAGGSLMLVDDALGLAREGAAEQVSLINTVPSAMAELIRLKAVPRSARTINLAGEPLPRGLAEDLYELGTVERVYNLYGPSEDTTYSTVELIDRGSDEEPAIGRAISNSQLYLLDGNKELVPVGVTGQIYLAGEGLARGYFRRPETTPEKFVPNPFGSRGGERMYATGDLGRYLTDGRVSYLGRIDHQVKVRGYRIELGEIETTLRECEAVEKAVVIVKEREPGDKRLVAYVVLAEKHRTTEAELTKFLTERLPAYMLPGHVMILKELPLTANGKLDRKALPDAVVGFVTEPDGQPRTPVEEMLTGIFAQVLRVERVSVESNFFELGGHSLLATQVMSRIRTSFKLELPLRSMFEAPTVRGLAVIVDQAMRSDRGDGAPAMLRVERTGRLPLSYAQQRLWFIDQLEPASAAYNMPAAIKLMGRLDIGALDRSINEIVVRHETLRTTFAVEQGEPVQVIGEIERVRLPIIDVSAAGEAEGELEARLLARQEAQEAFDLSRGPLVRVKLIRVADEQHVLLLTMHHIIADGWSTGILVREFCAQYEAFHKEGKAAVLPALPIQYADFAVWQRNWLQGEIMETQLSYWKQQLDELEPLQLLTDRARPAEQSFRGRSLSFVIDPEIARQLRHLSKTEGATLYMTLMAAFLTLLTRYTGQKDIAIGTPIANRNRAEVEGLIGFFVNTLVIRSDLSGNPTFREMTARVRETALKAYAQQDLPFERLVEEFQPERDLSRNPIIQVMFALQNAPMPSLEVSDLRLSVAEFETMLTRFDMEVYFWDEGETLRSEIIYSSDLFYPETIERMFAHYQVLLTGIAANPEQRILDLPMLTDEEQQELTEEWSSAYSHQ